MREVWLISRVTLSAILHNKVIYLIVILGVLLMVPVIISSLFLEMARQAGEARMAEAIALQSVRGTLGLWSSTATILGLFLGASAVSSEVQTKTIVTVLAKPLERWAFLTGKWIGIQLFLGIFMSAGVLLGLGLLLYYGVPLSGLFWISIGQLFAVVLVLSSFALMLSTVVSPVVAGGLGFVLYAMSGWSARLLDQPLLIVRLPALLIHYLSPARLDELGTSMGLGVTLLDPDYPLYLAVLTENALWAVAALIGASLIFGRREVQIK